MRVLVATQEQYVPFIMEVIQPYDNTEHVVMMNFRKPTSDWIDYDVGISFMWQSKIQKHELEGRTWFNFHPAPLPEYKGRNLCYHAIMNGEKEFGATLHYMDENFDTGNIIDVIKFPIGDWWTAYDVSMFAIEYSKRLFEIYFPRILAGEVFPSFPNVGGTYYPKTPIQDTMIVGSSIANWIRAVTFKGFYPKLNINGTIYKVVKE